MSRARASTRDVPRRCGRRYLRVPTELEAVVAWGYQQQRCAVTEFSTHGLRVHGLDAAAGTPLSLGLPLAEGLFTLCGVVVHSGGAGGSAGVRLLPLPPTQMFDLECYLWDLLAEHVRDEKLCAVVGCPRPRKARGLCSRHYNQRRRKAHTAGP